MSNEDYNKDEHLIKEKHLIKEDSLIDRTSNNQIESIDVRLFETCSNITELHLHNTNLTKLKPFTFKSLTQLEQLDL